MATKPANARGTRDFDPTTLQRRQYLEQVIRSAYQLYGFREIQTPALENLNVLEGKYGEEGDRLLFRILNSGDFLKLEDLQQVSTLTSTEEVVRTLRPRLTEKALRYDLTVPFARYVVQHQHEISFPFKRFQIQPVWRADRPQKGRYREFLQCDADVVGNEASLLHELEFLQLFDQVFTQLGLRVQIQLNHRKVLTGIAEVIDAPEKLIDLTVAIDKLDKIGPQGVADELLSRGFTASQIERATPFFDLRGTAAQVLTQLESAFSTKSITGMAGVEELRKLVSLLEASPLRTSELVLQVTLARGLNYYTGCIFEVKTTETEMGSIASGGRYDDLTSLFGLKGISGVGISFGLDRIYDVVDALGRWPDTLKQAHVQVLIANFGEPMYPNYIHFAKHLRENHIPAEVYPYAKKVTKQLEYANKTEIPFVILFGEEEEKHQQVLIKSLTTGNQRDISIDTFYKICNLSDLRALFV